MPVSMYRLVFDRPGDPVRTVPLPVALPLTLGRDVDNAIRFDDLTISRHHARFSPTPAGGWIVEDLQSSNGSRLNGEQFTRAELAPGDELHFGELAARYRPPTAQEQAEDVAREAVADPAVGITFAGRYRINRSVGETPDYDCFGAEDVTHGRGPISLRVFQPEFVAAAGGAEAMAGRFTASRATPSHPNVTSLLDFAAWRDTAYLAADWIDGHPLLDVLRHRESLPVPDALRFARQVAAATTHARAHRLPSPDLDPRALLISFDPRPKISAVDSKDWQNLLLKPVSRWPSFTLKVMPRIGAPEADYSFGALLCELLGAPSRPAATRSARLIIPSLGETGNAVLARGLSSRGEAFGGDAAFVEILARAADPRAYR